jgi:hypothetical protein
VSDDIWAIDETRWPDDLQAAAKRCRRGLEEDADAKFRRHVNEMKHLTTKEQIGEFCLIYGLGGEVDDALMRALKAIRIYRGFER